MTELRTGFERSDTQLPIGELLAFHAAKDPARAAVTFGDVTVSYAELDARSNRRARQLGGLGVVADDLVTIAMPKSIEIYELMFAIWKLGATPNLVSAKLPAVELQAILDIASPRLVIGPAREALPTHNVLPAGELSSSIDNYRADPLPVRIASQWKAMSSGGSTGRPKLIVDSRPGTSDPNTPVLGQICNDVMLNPGPMYHNTPFTMSAHCLFAGGHVIEMERFDPLQALQLIERHRVGWVSFVPTMMHRIWRLPEEQRNAFDLSSLRVMFHMAAPCPAWLKEKWIEWLGPERIFELYGGTEAQGFTVISGTEWLAHKGSVGKILPGCSLRVFNEAGEACAPGEIGTIYFLPDTGRGSTYRYIGASASTRGEWETLGDLGYLDADDYLYIVDRRTDLILSGGANIYPAEVEAALDAHPAVLSSIVVGLPDEDMGQRVHAIVQLSPSTGQPSEEELLDFLNTRLARNKVPRSFEFTNEFLRDDAGKARRTRMRDERIAKSQNA